MLERNWNMVPCRAGQISTVMSWWDGLARTGGPKKSRLQILCACVSVYGGTFFTILCLICHLIANLHIDPCSEYVHTLLLAFECFVRGFDFDTALHLSEIMA